MSETAPVAERPQWNTGVLWGLLAVLLVVGTLGAAFAVYAVTVWIAAGSFFLGALLAIGGGGVAFLAFLFMAGILYRVDRYRGANGRTVKFFE
ncbi:MAG: hypothetical protein ACREBT_01670 [Thermoplasmata archaeon]